VANYVKSTNFTAKDTLPTGDSGKIVKGTEIDIELNAVANAVASKADINSPKFTGTPTASTAPSGTNTTQIATTAFVTAALSAAYPVGSIYINASSSSNPSSLLGFGTWTEFGAGRVMVGFNSSDALFDTLEETGGSKDSVVVSHTHTATSTDSGHTHNYRTPGNLNAGGTSGGGGVNADSSTFTTESGTANITTTVASTGSSGTNANVQPYITVRMWKRTA
jgi:hypothetical protein